MRINARKIVIVQCHHCGKDVRKFKKEYDRQTLKRGQTKFYCDNKCSFKENKILQEQNEYDKNHPEEAYKRLTSSPNFYHAARKKDEFSPFRTYILKINQRLKSFKSDRESNIDVSYLKELWDKQNGICPYTGLKMILRDWNQPSNPTSASLDRIDSKFGYVRGNVEFVCMSINFAKNDFTKEEMMSFVNLIKNNK